MEEERHYSERQYSYRHSSKRPHKLRVKRYNGPAVDDPNNNDGGTPSSKRAVHEQQQHQQQVAATTPSSLRNGGSRIHRRSVGSATNTSLASSVGTPNSSYIMQSATPESPNSSSTSSRRKSSRTMYGTGSSNSRKQLMTPSSRIKHYNDMHRVSITSLESAVTNNSSSPVPAVQGISGTSSDDDSSSKNDEVVAVKLNDDTTHAVDGSFPSYDASQPKTGSDDVPDQSSEKGVQVPPDDDNLTNKNEYSETGVELPSDDTSNNSVMYDDDSSEDDDDDNDKDDTEYEHVYRDELEDYSNGHYDHSSNHQEEEEEEEEEDAQTKETTSSQDTDRYARRDLSAKKLFSEPIDDDDGRDDDTKPRYMERGAVLPISGDSSSTEFDVEEEEDKTTAKESTTVKTLHRNTGADDDGNFVSKRMMAAKATIAAARRRSQTEQEQQDAAAAASRLRASQSLPTLSGGGISSNVDDVDEGEEIRNMSAARRKKREVEKRRQATIAGALATAAMMEQQKRQQSAADVPPRETKSNRTKELKEKNRAIEAVRSSSNSVLSQKRAHPSRGSLQQVNSMDSTSSLSRVRVPERTMTPNIDVYSGQVIQPDPEYSGSSTQQLQSLENGSSSRRAMQINMTGTVSLIEDSDHNDPASYDNLENGVAQQRGIQLDSTPPLTKSGSSDLMKVQLPEKEYPPNIDVYTGLPISEDMSDCEAAAAEKSPRGIPGDESTDDHSSDSSTVSAYVKIPIRHCCWCCLIFLILAATAYVLVWYFVLQEDDMEPSIKPSMPPSPFVEPTLSPTVSPELPPTFQTTPTGEPETQPPEVSGPPAATPTTLAMEMLRDFLVDEFPSLEELFQDPTSSQYLALEWLAGNSFLESYSDERLKQRFTLATFYYSTGGDQWSNSVFWLSDRNECQWYTSSTSRDPCDEAGAFVNLELDLNNLSGTIPAELAILSNSLARIDLPQTGSGPFITGSLPSELGLLANLEFLNLQGNLISGALPKDLGGWQKLSRLDLSMNSFSNALPSEIGMMTSLTEIYLHDNQFDSSVPTSFGQLVQLKKVDLGKNDFDGPLPSEIGNLVLLQDLNLTENKFTLLPSTIGNLQLLRTFFAPQNEFTSTIPTELGFMSSLLSLDLSSNALVGSIPTEIGNLLLIQSK